jgi:esterase/lipase superfamily enzyme
LSDNWIDLANLLNIPDHTKKSWQRSTERAPGDFLWEYLASRTPESPPGGLWNLPDALRAIDRSDLADRLETSAPLVNVVASSPEQRPAARISEADDPLPADLLWLVARSQDQAELDVDAELQAVRAACARRNRKLVVVSDLTIDQLTPLLHQHRPRMLHFSGHAEAQGLLIPDPLGRTKVLTPEAFAKIFRLHHLHTECVVLNACFTASLADALAEPVPFVVGTIDRVPDPTAAAFARGFYLSLTNEATMFEAFEAGVLEIETNRLEGVDLYRFHSNRETARSSTVYRGSPRAQAEDATAQLVTLWFGTNRKKTTSAQAFSPFTNESGKKLHIGTCQVRVPESHKIGELGSPFWKIALTGVDDRLGLITNSFQHMDKNLFAASIDTHLAARSEDERTATVYIHGYKTSFQKAALQAAQLAVDLNVPGIMAFYSWPSRAKLTGYLADGDAAQDAHDHLNTFLGFLIEAKKLTRIHLIAHSMGNRALVRWLEQDCFPKVGDWRGRLGQLIFAAADVNKQSFVDFLEKGRKFLRGDAAIVPRASLYSSRKDWALIASTILHDNTPRAGFHEPYTLHDVIDTISVDNVNLVLLGHGYFAADRPVLSDIGTLLRTDQGPPRQYQQKQLIENMPLWRLK